MSTAGNPIKDIVSGGLDGIMNGAAKIIEKFKADPTKVIETEAELEKLRIQGEQAKDQISIQLEQEHTKRMQAEIADTANARDNNARIQESDKASWLAKNVAYCIDLFLAALWGTVTIILLLKAFKVAGKDIDMISLMALHGTVTAVFMTVVNFHRGTSRSSEDKQKQIYNMQNKNSA